MQSATEKQRPALKLAPVFLMAKYGKRIGPDGLPVKPKKDLLAMLPFEILLMIIKELTPGSLVTISLTARYLRQIVWNKEAEPIWIAARRRRGWPDLKHNKLHEAVYANLVEGYICSYCQDNRDRMYTERFFAQQVVLCSNCSIILVASKQDLTSGKDLAPGLAKRLVLHPNTLSCCSLAKAGKFPGSIQCMRYRSGLARLLIYSPMPADGVSEPADETQYYIPELFEQTAALCAEDAQQYRLREVWIDWEVEERVMPDSRHVQQRRAVLRATRKQARALTANADRLRAERAALCDRRLDHCCAQLALLGYEPDEEEIAGFRQKHAKCPVIPHEDAWFLSAPCDGYDEDTTGVPVHAEWDALQTVYIDALDKIRARLQRVLQLLERKKRLEESDDTRYDISHSCDEETGRRRHYISSDAFARLATVKASLRGEEVSNDDICAEIARRNWQETVLTFHAYCRTMLQDGAELPAKFARLVTDEPSPFVDCDASKGFAPLHAALTPEDIDVAFSDITAIFQCGHCQHRYTYYDLVLHLADDEKSIALHCAIIPCPPESRQALQRLRQALAAEGVTSGHLESRALNRFRFDVTYRAGRSRGDYVETGLTSSTLPGSTFS
ncbi:hypothetical protein JCM10908_005119 [Rhodotorula pacifica]|uniref:uncharacterized protein n=1 Tax=Rhodotorula pacifica TaxID=1495444 RepID=UPI00316CDE9A